MEFAAVLQEQVQDRKWLQAIVDNLPAMVGYWDRDLRNQMANRAYLAWVGRTSEQLRGVHISDLLSPELYLENLPLLQQALAGVAQHSDREIVGPTGVVQYSQTSFIPALDASGEVVGLFMLVTDVTARVLAELELQREKERTRRLAEQLTIVSRVSAAMHALTPDQIQAAIADAVLALGYAGSNLALLDWASNTFTPSHGRGPFAAFDGIRLSLADGATHEVVKAAGPVIVADYQNYPHAVAAIRDCGVRTTISLPVRTGGEMLAVLHAGTAECVEVTDPEVVVLSLLADLAGTALGNARRLLTAQAATRHYAEEAETDALTRVGNRRAADLMLAELQPGDVVAVLDLDHFKGVNDTHGHATGDRALQDFAAHVRGCLRGQDRFARLGGEEFLLVLPCVELPVADRVLSRIRQRWLATQPLASFSGGFAQHRPDEDGADTCARADAALYRAKQTGRDRHLQDG